MSQRLIQFDRPAEGIARITLDRPEVRNAQNVDLLYALNDAFTASAHDAAVKVIILAANGPHFSAGHDLKEIDKAQALARHSPQGTWGDFGAPGQEGIMGSEREVYTDFCERWRNLPKPTIAQVHGKCISGGLMLAWPCDLIIASDDAQFQDNTLTMGLPCAEWFHHPYELGIRKAKEYLFTADWISAQEAWRLGMVNHVVPRTELETFTLALADRICRQSAFSLKLAKEAVNTAQDAQGRKAAMTAAFVMHQLGHSHASQIFNQPIDPRRIKIGVLAETGAKNRHLTVK
jgi:enoyl-CoA hydratase